LIVNSLIRKPTKRNIVREKSFAFAVRVVELYKYLVTSKKEFVLAKQLLKSGTAIGALIRESEHAESKADFIHKLSIAQKEANETMYWLELLYETSYITKHEHESVHEEAVELMKILTSIIKKTKANINN